MNRPTRVKIEVRDGITGPNIYGANGGRHIAYCGPHQTPPSEYPPQCAREDRANAERLAACWNACDGIRELTRVKSDLLDALKRLSASIEIRMAAGEEATGLERLNLWEANNAAREAIARAEGRA